MQSAPVDRAAISVWRWQGILALMPATAISGLLLLHLEMSSQPWIVASLPLAALTLAWIWPPIYYRHLRYAVDDTGIVIQRGVLWRSHIALPRVRIQHTDVAQGPLQRRYGVATLRLYTAGSRHTLIELSGLAHADALELRDALLVESAASGV
jgi:membrane protein YdbS with pleckstrin-like domain